MKIILIIVLAIVSLQDLTQGEQASCNHKLEDTLLNDLMQMMLKIKAYDQQECKDTTVGYQKRNIVAFSASKNNSQTVSPRDVIKFNKVWTNIGNGYDPNTGIFTAPVEGAYQFTSTVMATDSRSLYVHLYHNNSKTTGLLFKAASDHFNSNTLNIILQVKKGDTICIESEGDGQMVYSDTDNYNSFSGYLI